MRSIGLQLQLNIGTRLGLPRLEGFCGKEGIGEVPTLALDCPTGSVLFRCVLPEADSSLSLGSLCHLV